jgi:fructose/tagatose bisphosphate aldolase
MKSQELMKELIDLLDGSLQITDGKAEVRNPTRLQHTIHKLTEISAVGSGPRKGMAQYLIRLAAQAFGLYPASINDLYLARGRGEVPSNFTVPAMNLRAISFDSARAVYRAAKEWNAGAFIFEIARSEIGYTDQRPAEYASSILSAGIAEGYHGPVFIQGDHFQVSAKRYAANPEAEIEALYDLIVEAIRAGFYNIDIDTSTMVDLSKETIPEQQALNSELSAMFTSHIRAHQPAGVTISVGGEIGEVGGHNSTEPELCAYMEGYNQALSVKTSGKTGLSKISIQTGTSHGGVVLPDGSIKEVNVDFGTLLNLSRVARNEFGLAGAVQHGASTLPEDAFGKFVEAEACEVHLATNFMNMLYDRLPADLKGEMYAFLDEKFTPDRKPGMTDEQFYYKTRKNAIGPFKSQLWGLDEPVKAEIDLAWELQFRKLFNFLALQGTREYVQKTVKPQPVQPKLSDYVSEASGEMDVSDLAD